MHKIYISGLLMAGLLYGRSSLGQASGNDPELVSAAVSTLRTQYSGAMGTNSRLNNGPEYVFYDRYYRNNQGHQFFNKPEEIAGEVTYDGQHFTHVPMLYDIHLDQVVVTHPTNPSKFRLVNEKVQSFSLQGHTFVRLVTDPAAKSAVTTGFYDLLFDQGIKVFAKREKEMKKKAEQNTVQAIFIESVKYFVLKDETYYQVNSIGSFANLFPDKKSEIQKYARSNKLKFNKASRDASIVKLAQFYASLGH
jgi:hypothetical protein